MKRSLTSVLESFSGLNVLVLGEAILDSYLEGEAGRLCREAPVPVVDVARRIDVPGGAANTAANVARLGARPLLLSTVGDDPEGELLRAALAAAGVPAEELLALPRRRTLVKHRLIAGGQMLARFDHGGENELAERMEEDLLERVALFFGEADAVIVSDYGAGLLTPRVVDLLARLQRDSPRVLVVDSKDLRAYRTVGPTAVKPNHAEALALLRAPEVPGADRAARIAEQAERLLRATGAEIAAVTLDGDGAVVLEHGGPAYRTYARPAADTRATGAGDTFTAAFALALAAGADTPSAAELASAAADVVVGKERTTTCSAAELRERLVAAEKHVTTLADLVSVRELYREQGRSVVFTNGCFDILHRGHVTYLSQAKRLGDLLVVGINSDESVRRIKGPDRPINALEDRIELLSALSCVDAIVPFDGDSPTGLLEALRPDVYVKGGDYTRATLPETELVESLGGEIRLLPYLEERSTTSVIERIHALRA